MADEHPTLQHAKRSTRATRILAIRQLLIDKGVITAAEVDDIVLRARERTPADGAKVVARAWVDKAYKARLLTDARGAVAAIGYRLSHDAELAVVENTAETHHLVVCTLCSCYPTSLLGPPPDWYKSFAYRQRAVVEPRAVLQEFGLALADDVRVAVVDSTADVRYLVLPRRPAGTQGMAEDALAELVTRDSMIGVAEARQRTSLAKTQGV